MSNTPKLVVVLAVAAFLFGALASPGAGMAADIVPVFLFVAIIVCLYFLEADTGVELPGLSRLVLAARAPPTT